MWKADKADRPSGIPFARNSPWAIVRGRFDKLPNNCQMLENNKVGADTRKNRARDSVNEPARLLASVLNVCTNGCSNTPMTPLRTSSWFPRSRRFERRCSCIQICPLLRCLACPYVDILKISFQVYISSREYRMISANHRFLNYSLK